MARRKSTNFDKIPSLHPERKGQLNISPKKNWVEKRGGLPTYVNSIATAIKRENPTWTISRAIATAVNAVKKMCATGRAWDGHIKVSKAVIAAACAAVGSWSAKKATAAQEIDAESVLLLSENNMNMTIKEWNPDRERFDDKQWKNSCLIENALPVREPTGELNQQAILAAASALSSTELTKEQRTQSKSMLRTLFRRMGREIPARLQLSDEEYLEYQFGYEFSDNEGEGVNDLDAEKYLAIMEMSAAEQMSLRLPVMELATPAVAVGNGLYEKEILRTGTLKYKDRIVNFTKELLASTVDNFKKGVLDYVPVKFVTDKNRGDHDPGVQFYGGVIKDLKLSDDGEKVNAVIKPTDDIKKIVDHNPNLGVSVALHPSYATDNDGHIGPTLLNLAITDRPRIRRMGPWKAIEAAIDDKFDEEVVNLSEGVWEFSDEAGELEEGDNEEQEEKLVNDNNNEGGVDDMADKDENTQDNNGKVELSEDNIKEILASDAFKTYVNEQVDPVKQENERLRGQVVELSDTNYKANTTAAIERYRGQGVPPAVLDVAEGLLLSFKGDGDDNVITLSDDEGNDQNVSRVKALGQILDNYKGQVDLSEEQGAGGGNEDVELSDAENAAVEELVALGT